MRRKQSAQQNHHFERDIGEQNCRPQEKGRIRVRHFRFQTIFIIQQFRSIKVQSIEKDRSKERNRTPSIKKSRRKLQFSNSRQLSNLASSSQSKKSSVYEESEEQEHSQKRARGRPKGSRNKNRRENSVNTLSGMKNNLFRRWQLGQYESPKSKQMISPKKEVKIQDHQIRLIEQTFQRKRRPKGRPKGVKNKLKSELEKEEKIEIESDQEYTIPLQTNSNVESLPCCFQCSNHKLKQSLVSSSLEVCRKILTAPNIKPFNLWQDISPENRSNVVLHCLRKNIDIATFQILLEKLSLFQPYFIPSWQYEGRIQQSFYMKKTDGRYLSLTGKQGNYALLQDCDVKPGTWWKQIGVKRILEAMGNDTHPAVIDALKAHSAELWKQIQANIPTLIRCGNYETAKYILSLNKGSTKYFKQHLEALDENSSNAPFKKSNLTKSNSGANHLSPIHILAINSNPHLLQKCVKIPKDPNVSDSLGRKPIHYAAVAKTPNNMLALLEYNADLKQTDKNRVTCLMLAAMYGKAQNLSFILDRVSDGIFVNLRCKDGLSALHYAIIYKQFECVRILLRNELIDIELQTRDKMSPLHLAAGVGNIHIVKQLLNAGHYIDQVDRFQRTALFFSIRNNNHAVSYQLLKQGAKYYKRDSSLNSLLHYCAAYGNTLFLQHFLPYVKLNKNRDRYYPWQIAVGKGHLGCIQLLNKQEKRKIDGPADYKMCFLNMHKIRYTTQSMKIMNILIDQHYKSDDTDSQGNRLLHILCSMQESQYIKNRQMQTGKLSKKFEILFKQQYQKLQTELVTKLQSKKSSIEVQNKNQETPITLCIERENIDSLKLLLKDNLNLKFQNNKGYTLIHYLSRITSEGLQGIKFTISKLQLKESRKDEERNKLRDALKKVDKNGFEAILLFIKDFIFNVKKNFNKKVKSLKEKGGIEASNAEGIAFQEYKQHENQFVKLMTLLVEIGCDANVVVAEKLDLEEDKTKDEEDYSLWGIQHFLMKFPSLVLLDFFKNKIKIRDFNAPTAKKVTPLHLFCQWNKGGCLFDAELGTQYNDYKGEIALQFLMKNGCSPNSLDWSRSTPLLYAALNKQYQFIIALRKYGSPINTLNSLNQVPLIEIIKFKSLFTYTQIETILKIGADPNFEDMKKETALHHLVYNSVNLDNSIELCKLFFTYGAKINSMDHLQRTPLFYCFTSIVDDEQVQHVQDKVEILQVLLKQPGIDLNHKDAYRKTALHYACEKNFFFSIIHLLDKKIEINVKDINGNTPLALCLLNRTLNQAALLIKKGVSDGYVTDSEQKKHSYFGYCMNKLQHSICFMLLDYGYPVDKAIQQTSNQQIKALLEKKYSKKK